MFKWFIPFSDSLQRSRRRRSLGPQLFLDNPRPSSPFTLVNTIPLTRLYPQPSPCLVILIELFGRRPSDVDSSLQAPTFLEAKQLLVIVQGFEEASLELGSGHQKAGYQNPSPFFTLPASSPYDNFLKAADC
ncbi:unnamed protein product [Victoria cruziana]